MSAKADDLRADPRSGVMVSTRLDDGPTPEAVAHGRYVVREVSEVDHRGRVVRTGAKGARNLTATRIDAYLIAGKLTALQWRAGERLASEWHRAGLDPRVVASLDGATAGSGGEPAWLMPRHEAAARCRRSVRAAMARLTRQQRAVVEAVVCDDRSLVTSVVRRGGKQYAAAWLLLRAGLDRLAEHYGGARH